MFRKALLIVLFAALIIIIVGFFLRLNDNIHAYFLWDLGGTAFFFAGTMFLLREGTFIESRELKISYVGFSLFIIGAMFKIMHWPIAGILLSIGLAWIFLLYFIHFVRKKRKTLIDSGKLIFVFSFLSARYLTINHLPKDYEVSFFSIMLLVLLVVSFIKTDVEQDIRKRKDFL